MSSDNGGLSVGGASNTTADFSVGAVARADAARVVCFAGAAPHLADKTVALPPMRSRQPGDRLPRTGDHTHLRAPPRTGAFGNGAAPRLSRPPNRRRRCSRPLSA
jgi:hypothetical protein